jgi:hypothetical protein
MEKEKDELLGESSSFFIAPLTICAKMWYTKIKMLTCQQILKSKNGDWFL